MNHALGTTVYFLVHSVNTTMKCLYPERLHLSDEEIHQYWENHECHLCQNGRRLGDVDPRAALLQHYRKSKDPVHKLWREVHYKRLVKKGGDKQDRTLLTSDVVRSIETSFPEYRVHLIKLIEA